MLNNRLFLSIFVISAAFIVPVFTPVIMVEAEDIYSPPQMFVVPATENVQILSNFSALKAIPKVKNKPIILPLKKPAYSSVKAMVRMKKVDVAKDIGVSKVTGRVKAVAMPDVNALALLSAPSSLRIPVDAQEREQRYVDTTIAFLPAGVDLTTVQQEKFQKIIDTYFIERDAKSIEVKVYATASSETQRQGVKRESLGAKRRALARGLNIRNWLLDAGVISDQIVLKAIGEANGESLPNRADIRILY